MIKLTLKQNPSIFDQTSFFDVNTQPAINATDLMFDFAFVIFRAKPQIDTTEIIKIDETVFTVEIDQVVFDSMTNKYIHADIPFGDCLKMQNYVPFSNVEEH
jgi:hypothetical protein